MITDKHRAFARAIVALAREHNMNNLELKFNAASSKNWGTEDYQWNQIRATWQEGRHGDHDGINIILEAQQEISEKIERE